MNRKNFTSMNPDMELNYIDFMGSSTLDAINKRQYSGKAIPIVTYRAINHWTELGIIDDERTNQQGWRRFSLKEIVWIHIIKRLRDFGFPNEKIIQTKEHLFAEVIFEFYIALARLNLATVYVLVFSNGEALWTDHHAYNIALSFNTISDDHVKINLNQLLEKIFSEYNADRIELAIPLSKAEKDLIMAIREGRYKNIKAELIDNQITMLNLTEELAKDERMTDLLKEEDFQDIQVIKREGNIVKQIRTTKNKYPRK